MRLYHYPEARDYFAALLPVLKELKKRGHQIFSQPNPNYLNLAIARRRYPPTAHVIALPHSMGGDDGWHYAHPAYRLILTPGEWFVRYWINGDPKKKVKGYPELKGKLKVIGFPKTDILFQRKMSELKQEILSQFHIKLPHEKTVLYSPTGSDNPKDHLDSFLESAPFIFRLSKEMKFNLIFKMKSHAEWLSSKTLETLVDFAYKSKNITVLKDVDNICKLFFVDVLISDGSSTIREFYLTDKPSLQLINFRDEQYKFEESYKIDLKTLKDTLKEAFNSPDKFKIDKKIKEDLFYKLDGKATERAVNEIENYARRNGFWN